MIYGYIFSIDKQTAAEQIEAMQKRGVPNEHIVIDIAEKSSAERVKLIKLIGKLSKGDLLYIESIDCLGGTYGTMLDTWRDITEKSGADILVLSDTVIDTRTGKDLVGPLLSDTVASMLKFVMQHEQDKYKKRQREGYLAAKARGVKFGRPSMPLPDNFDEIAKKWSARKITGVEAAKALDMPLSTFRYRAKQRGYDPKK